MLLNRLIEYNMLMNLALDNKMTPLLEQLKLMLKNGDTSVEEAIRIGIK